MREINYRLSVKAAMKPGPANRQYVLKSDQVSNLVRGAVSQVPCKQAAHPARLAWTKSITYQYDYEKCSFQL